MDTCKVFFDVRSYQIMNTSKASFWSNKSTICSKEFYSDVNYQTLIFAFCDSQFRNILVQAAYPLLCNRRNYTIVKGHFEKSFLLNLPDGHCPFILERFHGQQNHARWTSVSA